MKTNLLIAAFVISLVTLWMALGPAACSKAPDASETSESEEEPLPKVRVRESIASERTETIILRGKTAPSRSVTLKAEIPGRVAHIRISKGEPAKAGEAILEFALEDLPERFDAAHALVAQRELEYNAATKLESKGYQSQTLLAQAEAALMEAKANLSQAKEMIARKTIRAPFDGVANDRLVEVGDYIGAGDPAVEFIERAPMIVVADATEYEIAKIKKGQEATAKINGAEISGKIRFASFSASESTRSYRIEFEFPNADGKYAAGQTANITIEADKRKAHHVSPSLLYLSANTNGELGLKTVNADSEVEFRQTQILSGDDEGFWVTGLPDKATIITVGQGFVVDGSKVDPVDESTIQ